MNRTEHLLQILQEECNEVAQCASKANRFGLQDHEPGKTETNAERIVHEFNDLFAVMEMLRNEGLIANVLDMKMIEGKKERVEKWLLHSAENGRLDA